MANVLEIMDSMAETYKDRAKLYKNNYELIGRILEAAFPDGVTLKTADEHNRWHLYMMMLVKISRLACTGISHVDSAHDCAVYSAMLESLMDGDTLPIGCGNENNNI